MPEGVTFHKLEDSKYEFDLLWGDLFRIDDLRL